MQIVSIKNNKVDTYFPLAFPQSIENNTFEYFICGEGYKKTKKFQILDVELPDRWSDMSWLNIMAIHDKYGINVSDKYAERKVAGVVSKQTVYCYYRIYNEIKDIIPVSFDSGFFECLTLDYGLACFGIAVFDIVETDKKFSKKDPEYDDVNCTYRGENASMSEYVMAKYGQEYVEIINRLNSVV